MKFVGRMTPEGVSMNANQTLRFDLAMAVTFFGMDAISKIESTKGGDRLSFKANLFLSRTFDMFPGENNIHTRFNNDKGVLLDLKNGVRHCEPPKSLTKT